MLVTACGGGSGDGNDANRAGFNQGFTTTEITPGSTVNTTGINGTNTDTRTTGFNNSGTTGSNTGLTDSSGNTTVGSIPFGLNGSGVTPSSSTSGIGISTNPFPGTSGSTGSTNNTGGNVGLITGVSTR